MYVYTELIKWSKQSGFKNSRFMFLNEGLTPSQDLTSSVSRLMLETFDLDTFALGYFMIFWTLLWILCSKDFEKFVKILTKNLM